MKRGVETRHQDGSREIRKPDGSIVTVCPNGDVIIQKPHGEKRTRHANGLLVVETVSGERYERRPKLPRHARPLNVASMSSEEVGRLMSNFAPTPFILDGRRYASVESFYVCLKFCDDPKKQADIRHLDGKAAKRVGRTSTATLATYQGRSFELGSPEHHDVIKRAIRAKLEHNPELAKQFAATSPRPIVHDTGRPEPGNTSLPAQVFVQILEDLRKELVEP